MLPAINLQMGAAAMSNLLMSPTRAPSRSRHTASTSTSQALDRSCLGARVRHRVCDFRSFQHHLHRAGLVGSAAAPASCYDGGAAA